MVADRLVARQGEVQERRDRVEARLRETREAWRARATSTDPDDFADVVLAELDRVLPEDALLLEDAAGAGDGALRQMERPAGHFFRCAAPHPGWSLGAALGARLARPAQPVVALCDEVAFARALPAAAFWSAHREAASFLTVLLAGSGPAGARRQPEPDIASVARTAGAEVLVVDDPADIASSLDRLLATTRDGVCAVMDARVRRA